MYCHLHLLAPPHVSGSVVKEGGLAVLTQVSVLVLFGALISNLVCYVLWPQSATHHLRSDMKTTLDSFATLLALITDTFLLEAPPAPPNQERIARAVAAHQASFTKLTKDLSEAHSEAALFGGPRRPRAGADARRDLGRAYEDTIGSLHRLGQHLNGLRSGTRLQYELTQAGLDGRVVLPHQPASKQPPTAPGNVHETQCEQPDEEEALLQAAANMFGELVDDLGSPLKALSVRLATGAVSARGLIDWTGRVPKQPRGAFQGALGQVQHVPPALL
jgi:uncharacterized membrane protein YccC